MRLFSGPRCGFGGRVDIPDYSSNDPSRLYVTRWTLVRSPFANIYLHRYQTPDPRPTLHDHPWPFVSIVWRGSYRERRRYEKGGEVRVRWVNLKRSTDLHVITHLDRTPTWTLVITGGRCREWGYVDPDGDWTQATEHHHQTQLDAAVARHKERQQP